MSFRSLGLKFFFRFVLSICAPNMGQCPIGLLFILWDWCKARRGVALERRWAERRIGQPPIAGIWRRGPPRPLAAPARGLSRRSSASLKKPRVSRQTIQGSTVSPAERDVRCRQMSVTWLRQRHSGRTSRRNSNARHAGPEERPLRVVFEDSRVPALPAWTHRLSVQ
jgi:hypothetical protein